MHYQFHALTDPGRVRQNNEDAVVHDAALGLALLADGMGGYSAGEVASGIATTYFHEDFGRWLAAEGTNASLREIRRAMRSHAREANHAILAEASQKPECKGMGTTLVFGVFQPTRVLIGSIGDSRCYRLRGGQLAQLTRDHSVLQEQIDSGMLDRRQALTAPHRNLITRALGFATGGELDVFDHTPEPGDLYMFCSDGLSDMISEDEIAALLGTDLALESRAVALIDAANAAGGRDNVSVLLVLAEGELLSRSALSRWRSL